MSESQDDNPYAAPQADLEPAVKAIRRVALVVAIPVTLLAASIAFCCTCYPVALAGFSLAFHQSGVRVMIGGALFYGAWGIGLVVSVLVARLLWRAMRSPVKKREPDG